MLSCLLQGPPIITTRRPGTNDFDLTVGRDVPYRLAGPAHISLHARMLLRGTRFPGEADPWRVEIVSYQYTLLDQDQREILAFHQHPEGTSHVTTPHLHLGAGAGQLRADLSAAHVPTGALTLAAVARLVVEAFGVRPLRADWDSALRRSELALTAAHPS